MFKKKKIIIIISYIRCNIYLTENSFVTLNMGFLYFTYGVGYICFWYIVNEIGTKVNIVFSLQSNSHMCAPIQAHHQLFSNIIFSCSSVQMTFLFKKKINLALAFKRIHTFNLGQCVWFGYNMQDFTQIYVPFINRNSEIRLFYCFKSIPLPI